MFDKLTKKLEETKRAIDKRDDQLEQAAETAAPVLDEARDRLADASRSGGHERQRS